MKKNTCLVVRTDDDDGDNDENVYYSLSIIF